MIVPPTNVSVLPGETAVLTCVAFSTVQYNMTWQRQGQGRPLGEVPRNVRLGRRGDIQLETRRNLRQKPRMHRYNNGSLVIR